MIQTMTQIIALNTRLMFYSSLLNLSLTLFLLLFPMLLLLVVHLDCNSATMSRCSYSAFKILYLDMYNLNFITLLYVCFKDSEAIYITI